MGGIEHVNGEHPDLLGDLIVHNGHEVVVPGITEIPHHGKTAII